MKLINPLHSNTVPNDRHVPHVSTIGELLRDQSLKNLALAHCRGIVVK